MTEAIEQHLLEHAKLLDGQRVHGNATDTMAGVRRLQAAGLIRAKPGTVDGMPGPRGLYVDVSLTDKAKAALRALAKA